MDQGTFQKKHADQGLQHWGEGSPAGTLLVTCTDPVLDDTLFPEFASAPFLLWRRPGPMIPPSGSGDRETEEVLHRAVEQEKVTEIVVCGHLPSTVLKNLVQQADEGEEHRSEDSSALASIVRLVRQKYGSLPPDQFHQAVVEENVLLQTAHLRTYSPVLEAMSQGRLQLHSWIYDVEHEVLYVRGGSESRLLEASGRFVQPPAPPVPIHDPCDIYLA